MSLQPGGVPSLEPQPNLKGTQGKDFGLHWPPQDPQALKEETILPESP